MRAARKDRMLSAGVEFSLVVSVILGIDHFYGAGDRFFGVQPHPFWIAVLMLTVQYGTVIGLASAFAASAALLAGNLPPFRGGIDLYDYLLTVLANPLMWVMAAALLGELRGRQVDERDGLKTAASRARREAEEIALAYERMKRAKRALELRIAAQPHTVVTVYEAARHLQRNTTAEVIHGARDFLRIVLGATDTTFVLFEGDRLVPAWPSAEPSASPLYDGAVKSPVSGKVYGRLTIERTEFGEDERPSPETFEVCCEWIGWALEQAELLEKAASRAPRRAA